MSNPSGRNEYEDEDDFDEDDSRGSKYYHGYHPHVYNLILMVDMIIIAHIVALPSLKNISLKSLVVILGFLVSI